MKIDWISLLDQTLKVLGVFSIPSIAWNLFQYRKNNKLKRWESEKELKKLEVLEQELKNKPASLLKKLGLGDELAGDPKFINELKEKFTFLNENKTEIKKIEIEKEFHNKILNS